MTTVSLDVIIDAIETTLSAAASLEVSQSYNELTPGIPDPPTLQVWPVSGNTDAIGANDRTSFRGGVHVGSYVINADLYAQQRAHIGEDMGALVPAITELETILEAQDASPFFGIEGIKSFRWSWEYVTFASEGGNFQYVGARFTIQIWTF